jgi:hypothetical protein
VALTASSGRRTRRIRRHDFPDHVDQGGIERVGIFDLRNMSDVVQDFERR